MTVYVDDLLAHHRWRAARRGHQQHRDQWSRLLADTTCELLGFAVTLGLRRSWIQLAGTPGEHFDVTTDQRRQALAAGAEPISVAAAVPGPLL